MVYIVYYDMVRMLFLSGKLIELCDGLNNHWIKAIIHIILLSICGFGMGLIQRIGVWPEARGAEVYLFAFPMGVLLGYLEHLNIKRFIHDVFWFFILFSSTA